MIPYDDNIMETSLLKEVEIPYLRYQLKTLGLFNVDLFIPDSDIHFRTGISERQDRYSISYTGSAMNAMG